MLLANVLQGMESLMLSLLKLGACRLNVSYFRIRQQSDIARSLTSTNENRDDLQVSRARSYVYPYLQLRASL
jgi:hypothetical protein